MVFEMAELLEQLMAVKKVHLTVDTLVVVMVEYLVQR